jgi:hypothetical protein
LSLAAPIVTAQVGKTSSEPHPAPQISGRLIGTSGKSRLILEFKTGKAIGTFIGRVQSTCAIPAPDTTRAATRLELSQFEKGSHVTLFYTPHALKTKAGSKTENVILAIRFDRPSGTPNIAKGQIITCYEAARSTPEK